MALASPAEGGSISPALPERPAVLGIRDLGVRFASDAGEVAVVDGLSLDLEAGRTLGVVGESGCGKTVTALSVLRLVPPPGRIAAGRIDFDGLDLLNLDDGALEELRGNRIAMVFQEPMTALNPVYTIGDQSAEVEVVHRGAGRRAARDEAVRMLRRVGIPDAAARAGAYPHELSGGMRQRAMIAMALICRPAVLIADEPTTALDVTIQAQILDLMLELQAEIGMAVMFISHNLAVVSEVADRVAVMYAGRVVETAAAADLFAEPLHPYTRALIETLPGSDGPGGRLPTIPGQVPPPGAAMPGCRFANRCPLADNACRAVDPPLAAVGDDRAVACLKVAPP